MAELRERTHVVLRIVGVAGAGVGILGIGHDGTPDCIAGSARGARAPRAGRRVGVRPWHPRSGCRAGWPSPRGPALRQPYGAVFLFKSMS
ncbi:hypothetical protein AZ78_5191 [Lysobacter capsici AZ78]|uniref:Uncharacterized protein n=1 Tax=Lysobacter capsici AZ78 TaxID=1444315 RepID=A0A125TZH4_9GAMM|nr:hypothetical protein AZ78_5191 [Lysobacter capsici AZ78]